MKHLRTKLAKLGTKLEIAVVYIFSFMIMLVVRVATDVSKVKRN